MSEHKILTKEEGEELAKAFVEIAKAFTESLIKVGEAAGELAKKLEQEGFFEKEGEGD